MRHDNSSETRQDMPGSLAPTRQAGRRDGSPEAIERSGAEVITASDGEEALAKFREMRNPLVFADVRMPGMGGVALLRSVKSLAPDTTEVLITGFATQELAAEAAREGASRLLCKPLIDTPGVGPENHQGLRHLQGLLRAAAPGEVHLVVSASSKGPDTRAAVRAFAAAGVTHLLFTHLDETASCASVIDACIESGLPLSYVGTGGDIPGDLDPAEPRRLTRRTLQGAHTS
jgi:CheY-like chemotaxis protein